MIKWGILACGKIAKKFASDLNKVQGCELYAVASRSQDKADTFAQEMGALKAYGSYESLAQDPNVDVIYIASPHPMHKDNTILCLNNGKHVLCEKPMAMNVQEVQEMIDTAKSNNCFLMEAIWTQFFPFMHKLRELQADGTLEEISLIEADFGFEAPLDYEGRLYNPALGGSALLDIGIYPLFLAHSLLGAPDEISSSGIIGKTGVDVSTAMSLKWNSGALASLSCTILTDTACKAKIYCKNKWIEVDSRWHESKKMNLQDRNGIIESYDFTDDYLGYAYEIKEVNQCLKTGKSESDLLPLGFSLSLTESMQKILLQIHN